MAKSTATIENEHFGLHEEARLVEMNSLACVEKLCKPRGSEKCKPVDRRCGGARLDLALSRSPEPEMARPVSSPSSEEVPNLRLAPAVEAGRAEVNVEGRPDIAHIRTEAFAASDVEAEGVDETCEALGDAALDLALLQDAGVRTDAARAGCPSST